MNLILKSIATSFTQKFNLSRETKTYSIDEANKLLKVMERVSNANRSETKFYFSQLVDLEIKTLVSAIEYCRDKAVLDFLGESYGSRKEEEETVKAEVETGEIPPVIPTAPKSTKKKTSKRSTTKKPTGEKQPSKPVVEEVEAPKPETVVKMAEGMPEKKEEVKEVKATKIYPYDRADASHRTEMIRILTNINPSWTKDELLKTKAKELSHTLVGSPFMTSEGSILDSFIDEVKKGF